MNPVAPAGGNPFSPQATVVIEGSGSADLDLLTLIRPSIKRLETLVTRYRAEYREDGSGRAIAVHGDHGSGKTHTLAVGIRDLAGTDEQSVAVRAIYVRADDRSALSLYRKVMTQLPYRALRKLCEEARASYALTELADSRGISPGQSFEAIDSLPVGDDWVAKAFDARELQPSAVLSRQVADLDRLGLGRQDFERVIPSLLNPDLTEIAYRWFTGSSLDELDRRRLGVAGDITDAMQVRMGIQALLILCQRAGRPLALFIDQAESFACVDEKTLDWENVGILRALAESVPANSGLLVMAIRESAWAMLPEDLIQRFGPSEILTTGLTLREAGDLTQLYISHWAATATTAFSIEPDALREVLRSSGGNVREFLQLCSVLFTAAAPQGHAVDAEFARQVLSEDAAPAPTRKRLREDLTARLAAAHLSFRCDVSVDGGSAEIDFEIMSASGEVRAFLVVTDPLFGPHEAMVATSTIGLVRGAQRRQSRPAEVVLIVSGYMSADLASDLGEVHRVIVVTSANRERQLSQLVASLADPQPTAGDTATLLKQLDSLQTAVAELEARRDAESSTLRDQVVGLSARQLAARRASELDEARRKWRDELDNLSDHVRTEREARLRAELTELERLRRDAQRERFWVLGIISTLYVVVFTGTGIAVADAFLTPWSEGALLGLLAGVVVVGIALTLLLAPAYTRDLASPVGSQAELDRLAQAYIGSRSLLLPSTRQLLKNRNPQFRYAGTLEPQRYSARAFSAAIAAERSAIVRRAMVRSLVKEFGRIGFEELLTKEGTDPATSVAFEGPQKVLDSIASELDRYTGLSPELQIVASLYGWPTPGEGFVVTFIKALQYRPDDELGDLVRAYVREDDDLMLSVLGSFTERVFRDAATLLSPFEVGRVGTYDWLAKIGEVDHLFYFFRKCLFYLGRGLEDRNLSA